MDLSTVTTIDVNDSLNHVTVPQTLTPLRTVSIDICNLHVSCILPSLLPSPLTLSAIPLSSPFYTPQVTAAFLLQLPSVAIRPSSSLYHPLRCPPLQLELSIEPSL